MPYLVSDEAGNISRDVASEMALNFYHESYGEPELGRSLRKRIRKRAKKYSKRVRKVVKKVGPYALAPFTFGISLLKTGKGKKFVKKHGGWKKVALKIVAIPLAIAAVVAVGAVGVTVIGPLLTVAKQGAGLMGKRRQAAELKAAGKEEEALIVQAEAEEIARQTEIQADALQQKHTVMFTKAGYSPKKWAGLSLEKKLGVIDMIRRAVQTVEINKTRAGTSETGRPEVQQVPVEQRVGKTARAGDPVSTPSVTRIACPPGYKAVAMGSYLTDEMPHATSIRTAGEVGGYVAAAQIPRTGWIASHIAPSPTQHDYENPRSWSAGLKPRRRVRGRVSRRSHGLFYEAPKSFAAALNPPKGAQLPPGVQTWMTPAALGQEVTMKQVWKPFIDVALNLRDKMVIVSNQADAALRQGANLNRISGLRYATNKMIQMVRREWYRPRLYEKMGKIDPSISKSVDIVFNQLVGRYKKLVDRETSVKFQSDAVAMRFAKDFAQSVINDTIDIGTDLRNIRRNISEAVVTGAQAVGEAAAGIPGWLWLIGIAGLAATVLR